MDQPMFVMQGGLSYLCRIYEIASSKWQPYQSCKLYV